MITFRQAGDEIKTAVQYRDKIIVLSRFGEMFVLRWDENKNHFVIEAQSL